MKTEEKIKLYHNAINTWGSLAQTNMLYEECGELISALAKLDRGRVSETDVLTELADVSIMVEQVAIMIGDLDLSLFEKEKERKINRLKERLEKYKERLEKYGNNS